MKEQRQPKPRGACKPSKRVIEQREKPLIDDPGHMVFSRTRCPVAACRLEFPGLRYTVA
jgi:hypothetical protein